MRPVAPSSLAVTYVGVDCVVLEWTRPLGCGDSPLTHYVLEKRDSGRAAWQRLTELPPDVTECQLDNMAADKLYYMRVRAANQHGLGEPRDLDQPITIKADKRGDAMSHGAVSLLVTFDRAVVDRTQIRSLTQI